MSGFSADWLRLREPFDAAARDAAATAGLAHDDWTKWLRRRAQAGRALTVIDLGCGTGATLRYLAPRLGGAQHWQVWDRDAALLAAWPAAMAEWAAREAHSVELRRDGLRVEGPGFSAVVERHRIDLAHQLDAVPFAGTDLVCASALLDLVSQAWLARLVAACRKAGAALSFALSVDGRIAWSPAIAADAAVAQRFARHQHRDKGFGPALGPQAPEQARRLLASSGYVVRDGRSDWVLPAGPLQCALIEGMAAAAMEEEPRAAAEVTRWKQQRQALADRSSLRVGHVDIVAWPSGPRPGPP